MKTATDILLFLQSEQHRGTVEETSLYNAFSSLSDQEKRIYEKLLEAELPIEHLRQCLKNRIQSNQSQSICPVKLLEPTAKISNSVSSEPSIFKKISRFVQRTAYILNPFPKYVLPKWQCKTPPIIQRLVDMSQFAIPMPIWDRLHTLRKLKGMRLGISENRRRAIAAIIPCLLGATNIETRLCWLSVGRIATLCGLTTSRTSRALDDLAQAGLIVCQRTRDQQGHFRPIAITVTMPMIKAFNITETEWSAAQKSHKKLSKKAVTTPLSPSERLSSEQAAHRSLLRFKRRLRPSAPSLIQRISQRATNIAQQVEKALQTAGLGGNLTFSSA